MPTAFIRPPSSLSLRRKAMSRTTRTTNLEVVHRRRGPAITIPTVPVVRSPVAMVVFVTWILRLVCWSVMTIAPTEGNAVLSLNPHLIILSASVMFFLPTCNLISLWLLNDRAKVGVKLAMSYILNAFSFSILDLRSVLILSSYLTTSTVQLFNLSIYSLNSCSTLYKHSIDTCMQWSHDHRLHS